MSLYELTNDLLKIETLLENAEFDEADERQQAEEIKEIIKQELNNKAVNIAYYIRNLESSIAEKKAEEKRIKEIRQTEEKRLANFKNYVIENMLLLDKKKIVTSVGNLGVRTSKSVNVEIDPSNLEDKYKREKITVEADKKALKEALQNGIEIEGVELIESFNLSIR